MKHIDMTTNAFVIKRSVHPKREQKKSNESVEETN